jgi:Type IV secretion-system coupling protein DNA-binding domain
LQPSQLPGIVSKAAFDPSFFLGGGRAGEFRVLPLIFGIKDENRFLHVYIIGKTGTGKSTLIETMALQDLERGHGFALIDPHGDLVARIAAARPLSHHFRPAVRWRAAPIFRRTRINTLALGARLTGRTSRTSSGLLQTSAALANG